MICDFSDPHPAGFIRILEKRGIIIEGSQIFISRIYSGFLRLRIGYRGDFTFKLGVIPSEYDILRPVRLVFEFREPFGRIYDPSQTADYTVRPVGILEWQRNTFVHVQVGCRNNHRINIVVVVSLSIVVSPEIYICRGQSRIIVLFVIVHFVSAGSGDVNGLEDQAVVFDLVSETACAQCLPVAGDINPVQLLQLLGDRAVVARVAGSGGIIDIVASFRQVRQFDVQGIADRNFRKVGRACDAGLPVMGRRLFARSVAELERGDIVGVFGIPVDIGAAVVRPVVGETDLAAVGAITEVSIQLTTGFAGPAANW